MFQKGQAVRCIDAKMAGIGDGLDKGRIYHVEGYLSPEDCASSMPNNLPEWEKNGGRVAVIAIKGTPESYWYGRRFEAVETGMTMDN